MGSTVKNMPALERRALAAAAVVQDVGAVVEQRPMPWPQKSRTTDMRLASTTCWMA
jgi:hypothetical protein